MSSHNGGEDVVIRRCRDCGGAGRGPVKGTFCPSCDGSGHVITLVRSALRRVASAYRDLWGDIIRLLTTGRWTTVGAGSSRS